MRTLSVVLRVAAFLPFLAACPEGPTAAPCIPGVDGCEPLVRDCSNKLPCPGGYECTDEGTCEAVCPWGNDGCPCDEQGECGRGLQCNANNLCEDDSCPLGTVGCACFQGATCGAGPFGSALTCQAGMCVPVEDDSESPGVPLAGCYTPCTESIIGEDGTYRYCSPEGLMAGCIGLLECVEGNCVGADELPGFCSAAVECPTHQTCIGGRCLSNCELDSDCSDDAACYQHTCRKRCLTAASSGAGCDPGFTCSSQDGQEGFCLPTVTSSSLPPEAPAEPFTLSERDISLSNNQVTGAFVITNHSNRAEDFVVRKVEHSEVTPDGRLVEREQPLFWLQIGVEGEEAQVPSFELEILPGESVTVGLAGAFNDTIERWEGRLVVESRLGVRDVRLEYATLPEGQWSGSIHYFINFDDTNIEDWLSKVAPGSNASVQEKVAAATATRNAFLRQWTRFRTDPLYRQRQFDALVHATLTGSWAYNSVRDACRQLFSTTTNAECFLYADGSPGDDGIELYVDSANMRIPTGLMEMPLAIRLQRDPDAAEAFTYTGRIESPHALQYPGLPPVELVFGADPESCESSAEICLAPVKSFRSEVLVGGRYLLDDGQSNCAAGEDTFEVWETPWLVPHFLEGTQPNELGRPVRKECREVTFPYDPSQVSYGLEKNRSLSGANPIPDGRVRRRTLELMGGILMNQKTLFLLVRETFTANLSATEEADFTAYGLVQLTRGGSDIEPGGYEPGLLPDASTLPEPDDKLVQACTLDMIEEVLGEPLPVDEDLYDTYPGSGVSYAEEIASRILDGKPASSPQGPYSGVVHYLCHDTGRIDGAPEWSIPEACPLGSRVTYFLYKDDDGDLALPATLANCNGPESNRCFARAGEGGAFECPEERRSSCVDALAALQNVDSQGHLVMDPPYLCEDPNEVLCSEDRYDLTLGKDFYDPAGAGASMPVSEPLPVAIDNAFRFKTRFVSRTGKTIGFVPAVCQEGGNAIPYCYDPQAIERVRERTDCLVELFADPYEALPLGSSLRERVGHFLEGAFSFYDDFPAPSGDGFPDREGFERLYAELLIMLGDEAMTDAVASRFDLAGSQIGLFEGDKLEPDGIQLSGGAGFEMLLLYRATQYYQLVLDRFYRASPSLWGGLKRTPVDETWRNFITLNSISTYFNRLILASTKKAQAASEIARRYQSFNRPDLARHVIERTYTEAYLESIALSQFMRRSVAVLDANQRDALVFELDQAQLQYRRSLERMRETYQGITDEVTFFGDPPDYVPFPASSRFDQPPVRLMLERAFETLQIAKEREERALSSNRAFDVDAAQFQAELARVRQQYENELAELCGELEGADGHLYPAIPRYANVSAIAQVIGNPCGRMGNGALWDAMANLEARVLDMRGEIQDIRDIHERVDIERRRAADECNGRVNIASIRFRTASGVISLQSEIHASERAIAEWEKDLAELDRAAGVSAAWGQVSGSVAQGMSACSGINGAACNIAIGASTIAGAAYTAAAGVQSAALHKQRKANTDIKEKEEDIHKKEKAIATLNRDAEYDAAVAECCLDPELPAPSCETSSGEVCDPRFAADCLCTSDRSVADGCANPGPLMINSEAQIDLLLIDLVRAEIEARRADIEVQRALGTITSMRNRAVRLMAQQEETEQHLINVEAARNDPNIRIFANADILAADRTFHDGLVDAFRATRMYEYYTATSYAKKSDLFLVRMAGRGEDNLEDYLLDLQRDFNDFEQTYGSPSLRVAMVSLRDDIFRIPRVDEDGRALTPEQRTAMVRERLTAPGLLDEHGYIRVPFSTALSMTSPLTSVHKLAYVEAELDGTDLGDRMARLYLTAKGTTTIRDLRGGQLYHRMDPVTAVINPFLKGVRVFSDDIYQNRRLANRPLVNSLWELSLNLRNEQVNEDVNVNSITDIRLFFFYEDFTQL